MRQHCVHRSQRGMSLVELLVAMALIPSIRRRGLLSKPITGTSPTVPPV